MITADRVIWETGPELLNPSRAAFDLTLDYRYQLTRTWNPAWPPLTWIMLNPSTADAFRTDPTIRRVIKFSKSWVAGGITVVNLFAYRSTEPAALRAVADPVGELNDAFIADACPPGRIVIAAWGVHGTLSKRAAAVTGMLAAAGVPLWCLGTTYHGHPKHPLYVPGDAPLEPYQGGQG